MIFSRYVAEQSLVPVDLWFHLRHAAPLPASAAPLLLPITQRNCQVVLNCLTSALQEPLDPSVKAVRDGCRQVIILAFFSDYVAA